MNSLFFDTRNLPIADRLSAWSRGVPATFELFFSDENLYDGFDGYWRADLFGPFILRHVKCKQLNQLTQNWKQVAHSSDIDTQNNYVMLFVEQGVVDVRDASGEIINTAYQNQVIFSDAEQSFWGTASGDFEVTLLSIPRHVMNKYHSSLAMIHMNVIKADNLLISFIKNMIKFIQENRDSLNTEIIKNLSVSLFHLLIPCFNIHLNMKKADAIQETYVSEIPMSDRGRIYSYIYQNLADQDLSPEKIAKELGISRPNLYRLFSREGGIAKFIRAERLKNINFMLRDTRFDSLSLSEIAVGSGFKSDRVMARAYKKEFMMNPGHVRLELQQKSSKKNSETMADSDIQQTYKQWVNYVGKLQELV